LFPWLSVTVDTLVVVSFQPTPTTFKSPAVSAAGKLTATVCVGVCGVADASWLKLIGTEPV
jgi:hypothetical protein